MISFLLSRGAKSVHLALEHLISNAGWTTPTISLSDANALVPLVVSSKDSMDPVPLEFIQLLLIYKSSFHPGTLDKMLGRAILLDDTAPVSLFLEAGANLDFDATSSFVEAFLNSSAPVVHSLLEQWADPNILELANHLASEPEVYHLRDFPAKLQLVKGLATNDLDRVREIFEAVIKLESRGRRRRNMGPEWLRTGPTVYFVCTDGTRNLVLQHKTRWGYIELFAVAVVKAINSPNSNIQNIE